MLSSYGQKAFQGRAQGAAHVSNAVSVQTHCNNLQLSRHQPQSQQVQSLVLHMSLVHSGRDFMKTLSNLCKLSYKAENLHLGLLDYIYKNKG